MIIELRRFCEESRTAEAEFSPTQLPRLLDSVADTTGRVSMQVRGSLDARERPSLYVRVTGELRVLCQRCMRPMTVAVEVGQTLAFAEEIEAADGGDAFGSDDLDLDGVEVLPMMAHVDLAELIEEEVLLSMPMLPRHAQCDLPGPADTGKPSPFAALKDLVGPSAGAGSMQDQDN